VKGPTAAASELKPKTTDFHKVGPNPSPSPNPDPNPSPNPNPNPNPSPNPNQVSPQGSPVKGRQDVVVTGTGFDGFPPGDGLGAPESMLTLTLTLTNPYPSPTPNPQPIPNLNPRPNPKP
jgi:hypothetical protein